jgi:serine/threonine-protein kinase
MVDEIFSAALELPSKDREQFLAGACQGNPDLRTAVERLLRASAEDDPFFEPGGAQKGPIWDAFTTELAAEETARHGDQVGSYRVIREIGRGGMAVVYLARRADGHFEQQVALKLLRVGTDSEEIIRRFEQERQILASLNHAAIARLVDGGLTNDGRPFLAMEHVEGQPIDQYCDRHRLAIEDRLRLFVTVTEAVQYAHRNLVVHRDLKPSNILVTDDGQVKLLDFGIAKLLDIDAASQAAPPTRTGARVMTPKYASPEQVRGRSVTTASDVYQLGLLLYELMTGHRPYQLDERSPGEVERVICEQEPKLPSAVATGSGDPSNSPQPTLEEVCQARQTRPVRLRKGLKGDLDNIILMAIRKEPERRYASADQLRQDVESHLAGKPVSARKDTLGYRMRKFVSRHRIGVSVGAAVVVLIAALAGFDNARLAQERDRARLEAEKATQVSDFLKGLFQVSAPSQSKGDEISARQLLDRGAEQIAGELDTQPEIQAEMMVLLGFIYCQLGMYDNAEPLMQQALEVRENLLGEEHEDVSASLSALAIVFNFQGRYAEAEPLLQRSLAILDKDSDEYLADVTRDRFNLARIYRAQGKYTEAEALYKQVMESLVDDTPDQATALNNLAGLYAEQGKHTKAEQLLLRVIKIQERHMDADHPDVARSLFNLAALYALQKKDTEAEPLFRRALALREKTLGTDHPDVAASLSYLATVIEDNTEAAQLHQRALAIQEVTLGPDHPDIAVTLNNLASIHGTQGRYGEAQPLFRRALTIREQALGANHPGLISALSNLALILGAKGEYGEAESHYRRAVEILETVLGPENRYLPPRLSALAGLYAEQGRLAEAEAILERALGIAQETLEPNDPSLGRSLDRLAGLYVVQGRNADAEGLYQRALEILEDAERPDSTRVASVLNHSARLYTIQTKYEKAERFYTRAAAIVQGRLGEDPEDHDAGMTLAATQLGLGELLQRTDRPEKARASFSEAHATTESLKGDTEVIEIQRVRTMALIYLGRIDEARPSAEWLLATPWKNRDFIRLWEEHKGSS